MEASAEQRVGSPQQSMLSQTPARKRKHTDVAASASAVSASAPQMHPAHYAASQPMYVAALTLLHNGGS